MDEKLDNNICKDHRAYAVRIEGLERRVKSLEAKLWAMILLLVANLAGVVGVLLK